MAVNRASVRALREWVERCGGDITVLTGAGISTGSGLPDYRGPQGSLTLGNSLPMTIQDFLGMPKLGLPSVPVATAQRSAMTSHERRKQVAEAARAGAGSAARKRYWVRSVFGYEKFHRAAPNEAHRAVSKLVPSSLQPQSTLSSGLRKKGIIITQNVDGLHLAAAGRKKYEEGATDILELHGTLHRVRCISPDCDHVIKREVFQEQFFELNPGATEEQARRLREHQVSSVARPDGDAELGQVDVSSIHLPECECCGGVYRPDVVFFGDATNPRVVEGSLASVEGSGGLLVVGTTLRTFSAFRLLRHAQSHRKPIAMINMGPTRADEDMSDYLSLRLSEPLGPLLKALAEEEIS